MPYIPLRQLVLLVTLAVAFLHASPAPLFSHATAERHPAAVARRLYIPVVGRPVPRGAVRFAVIGDYGSDSPSEADVARLVKSWRSDFIVTVGDNNYPAGAVTTIDQNVGKHYREFIAPYRGKYGPGAASNRFFPTLGNHDWDASGARPYLDYFTLPGNERYYDVTIGLVHLFALDSDDHEPDGNTASSRQGMWLQGRLAASHSCWDIVVMHHSPYSSGLSGATESLQWPYRPWGADAVLAGHAHVYERLVVDRLPYFVNGLGGEDIHPFGTTAPGSQLRYNADFGAMLVDATRTQIAFRFFSRAGQLIDTYSLRKACQ
jgi:tartrate-resistant acid phosphatase type 5